MRSLKVITLMFTFLLYAQNTFAEYRVYQYALKNKITNSDDEPKSRIIVSSLDPVSYTAYNGGGQIISIDLLRTWMCPGNTSHFKDVCDSPYKKLTKVVL